MKEPVLRVGSAVSLSTAKKAAELFQSDIDTLDYDGLRAAIERLVPLQTERIELGGMSLMWHRVADPDQLLSEAVENTEAASAEVDPFWSVAWRAAQGMDVFLERIPLDGLRILELGSGAGHAGLAAAARGAIVTLTDAVDLALLMARLNSWPLRHRIHIDRLKWGFGELGGDLFPVIIGSDLVYDPSHFTQLEACAKIHLAPKGHWLLSEPNRGTGDQFAGWIGTKGWNCETTQVDLCDGRVPIRIFDCSIE